MTTAQRPRQQRPRAPVAPARPAPTEAPDPERDDDRITVDELCARWRVALDAAAAALRSARDLPAAELSARTRHLAGERDATLRLLRADARVSGSGARFLHLTPRSETRRLLGIPAVVEACVFNLDGVLVGSASLHAAAWSRTFDEFIWERTERTGGRFPPFEPAIDYVRHMHARPRLEGVRAFLASRGISLPEGQPDDPPGAETVYGLANRKNELLRLRIEQRGVTAYPGALTYLESIAEAGLGSAVVSASANTAEILERAGLDALVDCRIDGNTMVADRLRPKPAPDTILAACRALGIEPAAAASFETSPAGVEAAVAAGCALVVGIDQFGPAEALRARGASLVVPGLAELLERRLAA